MSTSSPTRVCVLVSSYEGSEALTKQFDDILCTPANVIGDDPDYHFTNVAILKATAYSQIRDLANSGKFDVFFNLCDGARDEDRAGVEVVQALEEFNVAFTGADVAHYEPTKLEMKKLAYYGGIKVPPFARVGPRDNLKASTSHLRFPVIVKHVSGYGSIGMTKDSKCNNFEELTSEAQRFIGLFGEVLIEEFIEGPEVAVLAFEDLNGKPTHVLNPIQINFPPGETFKFFEMKWVGMMNQTGSLVKDEAIAKKCKEVGLAAFEHILGGVGYGRCDLRVSAKTGEVFLLEINPNCGLFYPDRGDSSADLIMHLDPFTAENVARHMIQAAINRKIRRQAKIPPYTMSFDASRGYYLSASRDIPVGTEIFTNESQPFSLFTKRHVTELQSPTSPSALDKHVWPVSDEVYANWTSDTHGCPPFIHSCDPNLWFDSDHSLNIVARRDIEAGEPLSMEFATFAGPISGPFDCNCLANTCRKQVSPNDYTTVKDLRDRFGSHVTSHVRTEYRRSLTS